MANAIKALILSAALTAGILTVGCAKKVDPAEAVKAAVTDYLKQRPGLNVAAMDLNVSNVKMDGDKAGADVTFTPKGGAVRDGMTIHYNLLRAGDTWKVDPAGHTPHAGADTAPDAGGGGNPHGGGMGGPAGGGDKAGSSPSFHPKP